MSTSNSQVAHIWAQGNGESAKGSNFYCENNLLFSYRTLVGQIINGTVFLSAENMSPTTGKQLSYAKRAANYFASPAFEYGRSREFTPQELIQAAAEEMTNTTFPALCRKRKPDLDHYEARRQEIIETAARFDVSILEMPEASGDLKAKYQESLKKERERKAEQERQAAERREAEQKADAHDFNTWLQYGLGKCPSSYGRYQRNYAPDATTYSVGGPDATDYLTIRGEIVVTSQGAEAPLEHVKRAIKFYQGREQGPTLDPTVKIYTPYHTNGHKIPLGHFTLDEIDEHGNVKAGCHRFTAQEIARFINQWKEVL